MFCECGCGQRTAIARRTRRKKGWVRGEPVRFISGRSNQRGSTSHAWKGGRVKLNGYVLRNVGREHPMANCRGYCMAHRLVMAEHLGRMLTREEVVHHVNEIRDDNRIENLVLFASGSEHRAHHNALRRERSAA